MRIVAACRAFIAALKTAEPAPPSNSCAGLGTYISGVDLIGHRVLMSSGAILPITAMLDAENDETAAADEALVIVAGNNELWIAANVWSLSAWPTVH